MDFIMDNTVVPEAGATPAPSRLVVGRERLLGIPEVCKLTGLGEATASKLMKETGCCIKLHSRLYVIESSFFSYLHGLEASDPCKL